MANANRGIACLGWGSLIWDPRSLPIRGVWHDDGPLLPVEFARQSSGGAVTLVICPGLPPIRTLWCLLDVEDVSAAREALGVREFEKARETPNWIENSVGYIDLAIGKSAGMESQPIAEWATRMGLAAVVWTSLPCGLGGKDQRGVMPQADAVVAYLRSLSGEKRDKAETYVRKAPRQVDTVFRRAIERELGWRGYPSEAS